MNQPTVCFIGDSITAAENYTRILVDYFVLNHPEKHIMFYNVGIPGIGAAAALANWDFLVKSKNPTHATVMFGMNDMQRALYADSAKVTDALLEKRNNAIMKFGENIRRVHSLLDGVNVLAMTATPHDENPEIEGPIYKGYDEAITRGNKHVLEIRPDALDLHTILSDINSKKYVKTIIGGDRVHPGNIGQAIMAYNILKKLGIEDPALPLWDASFTPEQKAVLEKLGIREDKSPKNPYSDLRSSVQRRLILLYYVQVNVLDGQGITKDNVEGAREFLKAQLSSPIEQWRIDAYSDFLENRDAIPEIEAEVMKYMNLMYKA